MSSSSASRAALLCVSLIACTSPIEVETIDVPVQEPERAGALPGWDHQPDAAPPPVDPAAQPRLLVHLDPVDDDNERLCPYRVGARGLPAVDVGGTTMVHLAAHVDSASDGEDEYMLLSTLAPGQAIREQFVFDRRDDFGSDGDSRCEQAIAELREQVERLNAELAEREWLPLERLDVVGIDSLEYRFDDRLTAAIEGLPLDRRPVEILYRGDEFIARVRQAKVLVRLERPQWQRHDEFCSRSPNMIGLHVDRRTGLALIGFDHSNGGCLCDDHVYVDALQLPAELFAEVDRRPSAAMREGMRG